MKHKLILFDMYKLLQWLCGMEFSINLILQLLGWNCSVLSLVRIEQVVRKLDGNTYVVIFNDFARITCYLCFYL